MALSPEEKELRKKNRQKEKYEKEHKIINGIDHKICNICSIYKPSNLDNFYKNVSNHRDGLNSRCKECEIKRASKKHFDNHEEECKKKLEWHKKNPERHKYLIEKFRKNNKEHIQEYGINYRQTEVGKSKYKIYGENHRNKEHRITDLEWEACKKYFNYRCAYCGLPIEEHYVPRRKKLIWMDFHREHVIHTGRKDLKNCIPSCNSCNSSKKKQSLNNWYNFKNLNYTYERYHKIFMWLRYDYKNHITKRKPKRKYTKKNK
jgi:hypothetical protein